MTVALPARPLPGQGESWGTYLERVAFRAGTSVAAVGVTTGLPPPATPAWLASMTADHIYMTQAAVALRLPATTVQQMHLSSLPFLDISDSLTASDAKRRVVTDNWLLPSFRACPLCLRHNGYWQQRWRLPWVTTCLDHALMLISVCPRCRAPLRAPKTWAKSTTFPRDVRDPTRCTEAMTNSARVRQPCGASLTSRRLAIPATDDVLALQHRVDRVLNGHPDIVLGSTVPAPDVLEIWRCLSAAFLYLSRHQRTPLRAFRTPPPDSSVMIRALAEAMQVTDSGTAAEAAQLAYRWYDKAHVSVTPASVSRTLPHHRLLQPVVDALTTHTVGSLSRRPADKPVTGSGLWTPQFTSANLPQLACACVIPQPSTAQPRPLSVVFMRALFSIAVNRTRTADWAIAAHELGWNEADGPAWKRRLSALARRDRAAFYTAAGEVAARLDELEDRPVYSHQALRVGATRVRLKVAAQADTDVNHLCSFADESPGRRQRPEQRRFL